jgi:eukaryotic-like serine/threonine-protein kinase
MTGFGTADEARTVLPVTPARPIQRPSPSHVGTPRTGSDPRLLGRFAPGTLLGGRYRIVGLLGKGGMGEVYRAEDLTLGQLVAMKFLPEAMVRDEEWLTRFRNEVRAARQVSHPNVCRVYDIGDADSHTFLTMEFIQGEDLASLLRRIGRLSPDKAAEMARGLCAGLAAAHDKGVLHRDLKPANVMIDEQGRVRLADFGLAGGDAGAEGGLAGTPAYMAPELFERQPATVQSDIYALGLVLYEMFTGRPAFVGNTVGDLARQHRETTPTRITQIVGEIDPLTDRIIQRCLAKNPAERPASALLVAAALPGGDPLAAALAAGETPSPEMVAASGGLGALKPSYAAATLAALAAGALLVVWLSERTQAVHYLPKTKPPAVLADQTRTMVHDLGYQDVVHDAAWGFTTTDYMQHLQSDPSPQRWENLRNGQPPGVVLWFRQAPIALGSDSLLQSGRVTFNIPSQSQPGMVNVLVDLKGRLQYLTANLPRIRDTEEPAGAIDWKVVLDAAGFDQSTLAHAEPSWIPPVYTDLRAAWDGVYPDRPEVKIHIEAAAAHGRPVYFQIFEPWSPQTLAPPKPPSLSLAAVAGIALLATIFTGGVLLARRNLRLDRGDRAGAARVALALGVFEIIAGLLTAHHTWELVPTALLMLTLSAKSALIALGAYMVYMALEPDVRRRWPQTLVSWSRLITGRLSDPLVGRDLLMGTALGVLMQLIGQFGHLSPLWLGQPPTLATPPGGFDGSVPFDLATVLLQIVWSVLFASVLVLVYVMLFALTRRRAVTNAVFLLLQVVLAASGTGFGIPVVFSVLAVGVGLFTLARFGMLALIVAITVTGVLEQIPLTLNTSSMFAPSSYVLLCVIVAVAVYGCRASLAGQPLLGERFLD